MMFCRPADVDLAVASTDYGLPCAHQTPPVVPLRIALRALPLLAYYHLDPAGNAWTAAPEGSAPSSRLTAPSKGLPGAASMLDFAPTVQPPVYTFDQIAAAGPAPATVPWLVGLLLLVTGLAGVAGYARYRMRRASSS